MWEGIIQIKPNTFNEINKICTDISRKDSDFNFKIQENKLIVIHNDRNRLYKKIIWLINKVKPLEGCKFKVTRNGT